MPSDPSAAATTFPVPRVIPCQQCREHRKRCIRSRDEIKCNRCIQREIPCSLRQDRINAEGHYNIENEESVQDFFQTLRSVELLEEEIKSVEMQLQQRQPQNLLEQQSLFPILNGTESDRNPIWELTIHSSNSQKLTLNINIERTADLIQFLNRIHLEFATNIPRQVSHPQQETALYIPFQHRHFPDVLVQYIRDYSNRDSLRRMVGDELRISSIHSYHQQITPSLVQSYFNCRHTMAPLLHPEYYNQNQHNLIGKHLRVVIGCSMSLRYCINSPFFYLPPDTQVNQASYYIGRCNDLVEELMLLDNPPLSLPLLLLTLSSTHIMFQNARKSWLLVATARAYLQQYMNDYIDALKDKNGPSNPELETYKFALHLCEKSDEQISYIVGNRPAQKSFDVDDMLLMPKPVLGDNALQHAVVKQAYLFERIRRRCNSRIASSVQFTDSIRTLNWNTLRQINSDFTAWYIGLPSEFKIGDKPFAIIKMDIPQDFDASVASLLLTYYGEWVSVYGNTLGADFKSYSPVDEATLAELTNITFLAAMSVTKVTEFLSRVEMCKIEFYWLLFASEPLLHLAKSTDAYFANEARQALQKTLVILKTLLKDNLFSPIFHNLPMEGDCIALGQRLVERISHLFSSYGIDF